jgi:hypothetical protein
LSDPGKKNGLYWEAKKGDEQSPLGPLVAAARKEGYTGNKLAGAYDYVAKGQMIGGFALVAYPALYGSSGIMTFIVNHDGVVYQKDLSGNTEKIVAAMKLFSPDKSWKKVEEKVAQGK